MAKAGPIILLEDDADDQAILTDIFKELKVDNPLLWFKKPNEFLDYLRNTADQPFIILCDINLPGQNGLELKKKIDSEEELRRKSIPFIFYSTSVNQRAVNEAYLKMTVQGFFQKNDQYEDIKNTIRTILEYWNHCKHPNVV